jgi:death on curing protein
MRRARCVPRAGLIGRSAISARNHPLPDGNKRAAFVATERFLTANGRPFKPDDPDTDVPIVEQIAAGELARPEIEAWLEQRTTPRPS